MATHYFFKFHSKNAGFIGFVENKDNREAIGTEVPLSIFYGNWLVEDYRSNSDELFYHWSGEKLSPQSLSQVKRFFEIEQDRTETCFWVFLDKTVYCLTPEHARVVDGPRELIDKNGSTPKTIHSRIVLAEDKHDLPEGFATLNANQRYNSRTIAVLKESEHTIAEHLYKHGTAALRVSSEQVFEYLSPLQLETLLFLIFVRNDLYASTWRGGTQEKYDLRIDLDHELRPFPKGPSYIQVKKKETSAARRSENYWVVHSGSSDFTKRLVGRDWVEDQVRKSEYLMQWLSRSLAFIEINWT